MRWGFKAEAERIAVGLRREMGLRVSDRLDPTDLAKHLAIPVLGLSTIAQAVPGNGFGRYFSAVDPDSFSAITLVQGHRRLIVHNDAQHPNRQRSNLAHELSHTILEHEPAPLVNVDGKRFWDGEMEREATWLGAALLVPRDAALAMVRSGRSLEVMAGHFGVSEELCAWRIRQTGILVQLERTRKWHKG
jgi:Zn-dependent peptidase ImmA (M78 family)